MISLILPTRGRPKLVARLFDSIAEKTRELAKIEVIVYIDDDDSESLDINDTRFSLIKIVGPRLTMGGYNSECLKQSSGEIIILINDDMVIRTQNWDDLVRELHHRFSDGIYLGYANDLYKGRGLCAFPILSRRCCDALTEPYPAAYRGAFIDYHLLDIFKRLEKAGHFRICYLDALVFEHMHFRSGKAALDATYTARNRFGDDPVFLGLRNNRSAAASTLAHIITPDPMAATKPVPQALPDPGIGLMQATLMDAELPLRWALRLYFWFLARVVAGKVLG